MLWQVFLSTCAVGCAFHFLYAPLGKPRFLRWLLPISESPWEHFKLVFWPLGGGLAVAAWLTDATAGAWVCAWVVAAGHGFCTMTGIYYFYRGALGVARPLLWVDISNYFIILYHLPAHLSIRRKRFVHKKGINRLNLGEIHKEKI